MTQVTSLMRTLSHRLLVGAMMLLWIVVSGSTARIANSAEGVPAEKFSDGWHLLLLGGKVMLVLGLILILILLSVVPL